MYEAENGERKTGLGSQGVGGADHDQKESLASWTTLVNS